MILPQKKKIIIFKPNHIAKIYNWACVIFLKLITSNQIIRVMFYYLKWELFIKVTNDIYIKKVFNLIVNKFSFLHTILFVITNYFKIVNCVRLVYRKLPLHSRMYTLYIRMYIKRITVIWNKVIFFSLLQLQPRISHPYKKTLEPLQSLILYEYYDENNYSEYYFECILLN